MSFNGTVRSLVAASRRYDRAEKKRKNELERRRKEFSRLQEVEQAHFLVEEYENHIGFLISFHKETTPPINWTGLLRMNPPPKIPYDRSNEFLAQTNLNNYTPSFLDRKLRKTEKKRKALEKLVEESIKRDQKINETVFTQYKSEISEYEESKELAEKVLDGSKEAYDKAMRFFAPFSDLNGIGTKVSWGYVNSQYGYATLEANSKEVVPLQEKYLLKSGKLGSKQMAKRKYWELYQDHVCSSILRIARELFSILPLDKVVIDAKIQLLNPKTGYMENTVILSVLIPKQTLNSLNFEHIDCSDALENFVHHIRFSTTKGFSNVESLK